jgi:hypothetical protein
MSEKRRTFDRDDGAEFMVTCLQCAGATRHHVIRSVSDVWTEHEFAFQNTFQIVECRGCKTLSVRHDQSSSEDAVQYDAVTGEQYEPDNGKYYPLRSHPELPDAHFLPFRVGSVYREVLTAHASGLPILAQVGLGCLIEAICDDLHQQGTLRNKINGLIAGHVLREAEAAALHRILDLRNDAAHRLEAISEEALSNAIGITEHMLVSIYLLEARRRGM